MEITEQEHTKILFITKLGRALHAYGSNSQKIETILKNVSAELGLRAQFFSTPTALIGSFQFVGKEYGVLERCAPGAVHLERICLVNDIADEVMAGKIGPDEGSERLDAINVRPQPYPNWVMLFVFGLASASVSVVLGAHWVDLLPAFLIGLVVGALTLLSDKIDKLVHLGDILCAFLGALIAGVANTLFPAISREIVLLAGLIYLMPGLSITVSTVELATQNLVAGSARLVGAAMSLLKIFIGVLGGTGLVTHFFPSSFPLTSVMPLAGALPAWSSWISILVSAVCFAILFRAHVRDMAWIVVTAFTVSIAYEIGKFYGGVEFGAFVGSFVVSAGSNLFGRLVHRPVSIIQFPGILFLVPGLMSYRSLNLLANNDVITGIGSVVSVGIIAMIIVGGLLCGNLLINPKREL